MGNKALFTISILFASAALFFGIYNYISRPTITFIRIAEIWEGYEGTKEAKMNYDKQLADWRGNLDTLQAEYSARVEVYEATKNTLNASERDLRETELRLKGEEIIRYENTVKQKAAEEEQKMTDGILLKINDFVKKYAKKQGYEVVLGATASGNVMFGKEHLDVTEEILKALNDDYR